MKAKLIVEGKEFDIEIQDPKLQKLITQKQTGYEHVDEGKVFYSIRADGTIFEPLAKRTKEHEAYYEGANYYSSRVIAENNARADKLMRQLRRFAVEYRNYDKAHERYYIYYLRDCKLLQLRRDTTNSFIGPWFDNQHAGALAIATFHDELIWYFTEYKDSL